MKTQYKVVGQGTCWGVSEIVGNRSGIVYDLLESQKEAEEICTLLNSGVGPEWDALEPILSRGKQ